LNSVQNYRLTPLKFVERQRPFIVNKGDLSRLESKILELESQIISTKVRGEDRKLDKLEYCLIQTGTSLQFNA